MGAMPLPTSPAMAAYDRLIVEHTAEERRRREDATKADIRWRVLHASPEWDAMRKRHERELDEAWDKMHGL